MPSPARRLLRRTTRVFDSGQEERPTTIRKITVVLKPIQVTLGPEGVGFGRPRDHYSERITGPRLAPPPRRSGRWTHLPPLPQPRRYRPAADTVPVMAPLPASCPRGQPASSWRGSWEGGQFNSHRQCRSMESTRSMHNARNHISSSILIIGVDSLTFMNQSLSCRKLRFPFLRCPSA